MDSRTYAINLRKLADFLDSRPKFETSTNRVYMFLSFYKKNNFVNAVRALGSGTKEFSSDRIFFCPEINDEGIQIRVEAPRQSVCRLISEAVYDCESLLSPDEETAL